MNRFISILVVLGVAAGLIGGGVWYSKRGSADKPTFRSTPVTRGDLLVSISATGTVEPEEVVDVGAQVTGKVIHFGTDTQGRSIDYGSTVEKGKLLALIDPTLYQADLEQAQAQLEANKAAVLKAQADLGQLQAKLTQAQRDWERAQKLGPSDALSQVDYDAYESGYEVAKANVAVGQAAVEQAQKTVAQTEASMVRAKQNVEYCTINSPVDGVVIDRRVNVGQTVVSNLNASSLFLLATDMKKMEVWVSVNEADIGNIRPHMPVTFTVDAYPGMPFKGEVTKVRLNATMTQSVVVYIVEVETENPSGKLLPYLSANVTFEISKHDNVLMAPNAALRYSPRTESIAPGARPANSGSGESSGSAPSTRPFRRRSTTGESGGSDSGGQRPRRGTLWVQDGQFVKPVEVMLGATDGINTEIVSGEINEGSQVVTGEVREDASAGPAGGAGAGGGAGGNPFIPQMPRGGRGGGGGGGGGGRGR